jgi:hypothetical protein
MTYDNNEGPIYSVLNGKPMTYCCNIGCPYVPVSECQGVGHTGYATEAACFAANDNGC